MRQGRRNDSSEHGDDAFVCGHRCRRSRRACSITRCVTSSPAHSTRITVDGDTSTNDTLLVLANGASGAKQITQANGRGLLEISSRLWKKSARALAIGIVEDGEGATHVVEIEVRGAPNDAAAKQVAQTIALSSLVKTAIAGADPNWGRILAAAGRSGVPFNPDHAEIWLGGMKMYGPPKA